MVVRSGALRGPQGPGWASLFLLLTQQCYSRRQRQPSTIQIMWVTHSFTASVERLLLPWGLGLAGSTSEGQATFPGQGVIHLWGPARQTVAWVQVRMTLDVVSKAGLNIEVPSPHRPVLPPPLLL